MLRVRPEQLDALARPADEAFAREVLPELKTAWPSRCVQRDDEVLLAEIVAGISDARRFGVTADEAVVEYLHILFLFGPGFPHREADEWARTILTDETLPQTLRVVRLHNAAVSRVS